MLAPGAPATMTAGWVHKVENGLEVDMGEVKVETGAEAKTASVAFLDASGNPTTPDETPTWSSSDEAVATVAVNEDGLSATVSFVGVGSAIIECLAIETNEAGETTEVKGVGFVTVESADAATAEITFS